MRARVLMQRGVDLCEVYIHVCVHNGGVGLQEEQEPTGGFENSLSITANEPIEKEKKNRLDQVFFG